MKLSRRKFITFAAAGAAVAAAPGVAAIPFGRGGVEYGDVREDSLWMKEAPPIPPARRLEGEREVDVAIIGGGYTGLSCAYYCKKLRPELSVILLESHRLGSGASSRNSGAVSQSYRGFRKKAAPSQSGFKRLMQFIEEEEIECDLRRGGVLELYASPRSARAARETGPALKWISPEELSETFQSPYYAGASVNEDYVMLHPAKLVAGHVRAAMRAGAELFEYSPVVKMDTGIHRYLITPGGRVAAKAIFIATNAYTPRLGLERSTILPVHQFTLASRQLSAEEISRFALDRWPLRFERGALPVTNHLTPSGHFFIRIVLGYASFDSCMWKDSAGARDRAGRMFAQRYPWIADIKLNEGWHGVTGHTLKGYEVAGILRYKPYTLISAAYNGLGIMPGHNNGYLAACRFAGVNDEDAQYMSNRLMHHSIPGEFYRSLLFKPFMKLMTPV